MPINGKRANPFELAPFSLGGAERDRTAGLQSAILALSQLSYCPIFYKRRVRNPCLHDGVSLSVSPACAKPLRRRQGTQACRVSVEKITIFGKALQLLTDFRTFKAMGFHDNPKSFRIVILKAVKSAHLTT
jgi:hypothetical protein